MTKVDILQGALDMLVLKTLGSDPTHGFAIALRIRQLTDKVIQIGEGSLYPALYRMELKGLIKAEWGAPENNRRAKYYKVARTGRKQLEGEVSSYICPFRVIRRPPRSGFFGSGCTRACLRFRELNRSALVICRWLFADRAQFGRMTRARLGALLL